MSCSFLLTHSSAITSVNRLAGSLLWKSCNFYTIGMVKLNREAVISTGFRLKVNYNKSKFNNINMRYNIKVKRHISGLVLMKESGCL